jgi:hypothetical protein
MASWALAEGTRGFHVERFSSEKVREPILLRCWCGIGHDHDYTEWVERYHTEAEADAAELGLTTYRPIIDNRPEAPEPGMSER